MPKKNTYYWCADELKGTLNYIDVLKKGLDAVKAFENVFQKGSLGALDIPGVLNALDNRLDSYNKKVIVDDDITLASITEKARLKLRSFDLEAIDTLALFLRVASQEATNAAFEKFYDCSCGGTDD